MTKVSDGQTDAAAMPSGDATGSSASATASSDSNKFTLDEELLESRGFFSSETKKTQRLALEMRGIKRRLLRRLGFSRRRDSDKRGGNVVLVTSTRPAEGKTFTAMNLVLSLVAEDGVGAVLVDADAPRPRVLHHLGLENDRYGLTDLLSGVPDLTLEKCLLHARDRPLSLLPVGKSNEPQTDLFAQSEMKTLVRDLGNRFSDRLVVIDTPPVLAMPDAVLLATLVDEVIFVVEANATNEPAVATALDELLEVTDKVSLVLNRCLVPGEAAHYYSYEEYYSRKGRGYDKD
ncbi:MAG: hypothetical protein AAGA69_00110 [Pseudomonadota bacterium]